MSKSGRWVASPTAQGASQAHSFFGRPSKAAANSPQGFSNQPQGMFNQPHKQNNGQSPTPLSSSWSDPSLVPNGTAQHGSSTGSMPTTSSAAAPAPGRWQGFTRRLRPRPRPQRHGSGALLVPDPAALSSIAGGDQGTGGVNASLPAYQSADLAAAAAASSANKRWAISAPSLSPKRSPAASQGSSSQAAPSQGSYIPPSPWSTPAKQPQSAAPSPGGYPVPSPQSTPLGTPPQPKGQSPSATVGPFEAAALARAARRRAQGRPGGSASSSRTPSRSPAQPMYPVPSPAVSDVPQQAGSNDTSPAGPATLASSQSQTALSQGWAGNSSGSASRRRRQ